MAYPVASIVQKANALVKRCKTRDPYQIAADLGIQIIPCDFKKQRGAYKVIMRNRFIFLNENLSPIEKRIVLFHELGHDALHRQEAVSLGGFQEFEIFNMADKRMEYEANVFAAQLELDDEEFLEYCKRGYDIQQIASAMNSDINLIALKADTLILQGHRLHKQEHKNDFLKYAKHM